MSRWNPLLRPLELAAIACLASTALAGNSRLGKPALGVDLPALGAFSTVVPFVDLFKNSDPWVSQQKGKPWGRGPSLQLDQHGWVSALPTGTWAEATMLASPAADYPGGEYSVTYSGRGRLTAWGNARVVSSGPGRLVIEVRRGNGPIHLKLSETDPTDHVRDIKVLMPGTEASSSTNPFNPEFVSALGQVSSLRFGAWQKVDEECPMPPSALDATYASRGVPAELLCLLANQKQADPWFSVHDQAGPDAVAALAKTADSVLDHALQPVVEFSHEVWNPALPQFRRVGGATQDAWEVVSRNYAQRSGQAFSLWATSFPRPFVRAVAVPLDDIDTATRLIRDCQADALCVRPSVTPPVGSGDWSASQISLHLEKKELPALRGRLLAAHSMASARGLFVIAYGGDIGVKDWAQLGGSLYCSTTPVRSAAQR